ncbi:methyltransferase domain-containing protein [Spirosoma horti]
MSKNPITFNGSVPQQYDDYLGPFLFEPYALDLVDRIDPSSAGNVLELACGTGRVTKHLAAYFPTTTQLVATDLNPDMIAVAQEKIASPNLTWATVDMSSIPYPDGHFDLVISQYGLMFAPDKLQTLIEIRRVLARGGKLIFNTWGNLADNPVWNITNSIVSSFIGISPITLEQGPFSMSDKAEVLHLLDLAGFKQPRADAVNITSKIESAALAAKGFIHGLPIAMVIQQKNPSLLPQIQTALADELSKHFGDFPLQTPLQAWVFDAMN